MKRIREKTTYISDYLDPIFVRCPKCNSKAEIFIFNNERRLHCSHCNLIKNESNDFWHGTYKLSVSRCPNCGNRSYYSKNGIKLKTLKNPTKNILCSVCKKVSKVKIEIAREYNTMGIDPYFGLPLWLQKTVDTDILWFYNYTHLQDIKDYLSADLREKMQDKIKTMFSKLPRWIKLAKHRERLIETINQIERF